MQVGLYIHIPFCKAKCYYCDFLSFVNTSLMQQYIDTLLNELLYYKQHQIKSIFIGGGTPSVLPPFLLAKLLEFVEQNFIFEETKCFRSASRGRTMHENMRLPTGLTYICMY